VSARCFVLSFPILALTISCSPPGSGEGESSGPPATEELAEMARDTVADALPLSPTQLAGLESALHRLQSLTTQMQGASHQGEARLVQRELSQFLDGLDRPLPFRKNLERIVEILSESSGDELTDGEKSALRSEMQEVLSELGIDTSGSGGEDFPPIVPGPGPGGPGPGGPGPRPGPPGPGPGPPH